MLRKSSRKGSIRIEALMVRPLENNVYIVYEDGNDDCIIIDVAQGANELIARLDELKLRTRLIVNTHGHTDHTAEDGVLVKLTGAKVAIHELDAYRLAIPDEASEELGLPKLPIEPDMQLVSGQRIPISKARFLTVLHTPGHTEGSICLWEETEQILFSGDTLFSKGFGRVDGMGGSLDQMKNSLKKLLELPSSTDVYPGHGAQTTIAEEKWLEEFTVQKE